MRIGVIYLGRRGSGGLISINLAVHLSKQADVFAVLSSYSESLPAWQRSGIEQVMVRTYRTAFGALWAWVNQKMVRQIARQIEDLKPDVLIYPMFYTLNPLLQKFLPDIPSLVAVHDPIPHPDLAGRVYRILEDYSIRQASRCLVFSQTFVAAMHKRGVPPDRLEVIPHGELAYLPPIGPARAGDAPLPKDRYTLLFFGRITAYKGLDILFDAYRMVRRDLPIGLLVVGSGDLRPYRFALKGLEGVEIINRWIAESEVWQYFSQADLVVLPYTSASQSGVISVAASYALPVIATRVGGISEQIEDGRTGLLIEPASVDQLAQAIRKLVNQPGYAKNLGAALHQRYKEDFSWEIAASQILAVCEKVLG